MPGLSILWHFHQPDYRDPVSGRPVLPWVRHHALRGYRDLPLAILEHEVPCTVNLVPTLLEQLAWYAEGGSDPWLDRLATPAAELSPDQRAGLLREGFSGHPAMVLASPGWRALQAKVAREGRLDEGELRDLQVWSVLGWTGFTARRDHPALQALVDQDAGFTEQDKARLLAIQARICAELPALWARLPEVSASPWGHPILPLLVDARHGRRCLPLLPEVDFAWPGDARLQLARGRAEVSQALGREITGLWPSEGAVSPEVVALAADAGFRWLATDEGVLQRSERSGTGQGPWRLGADLVGFFRDRDLSDHVGFRTAGADPAEAACLLLDGVARQPGHVTLALDGENPWESHGDAGEGFLRALFSQLRSRPDLAPQGFAEAAEEPVGQVTRLFTGGWINADFAIWIGDEEDRAAWRLLQQTRAAVAEAGDPPEALQHVLAAEGSDWFWWYGPEFHTDQDDTFDRLFRSHLQAAWRALGQAPPRALGRSLLGGPPALRDREPTGPVDPASPLGWWGAGCWDGRRPQGAMALGAQPLDRLLWGVGAGGVHVRLVPRAPLPPMPEAVWVLCLTGPEGDSEARVPHAALTRGSVDCRLAPRGTGEHRLGLRLERHGEPVGALGPPDGWVARVPRASVPWREGWV